MKDELERRREVEIKVQKSVKALCTQNEQLKKWITENLNSEDLPEFHQFLESLTKIYL